MFFPNVEDQTSTAMVFVDGENLAIRYGAILKSKGAPPAPHVQYKPDIYVWSAGVNTVCLRGRVIRKYFYTSVQGDDDRLVAVTDALKAAGLEAPHVFKKSKGRPTKRVDISLATHMLLHASRKNYDIAVLVAGDEDYVPLVEAVKTEGRRVFLWFVSDGLSPVLRRAADHYADLGEILFSPTNHSGWR
ncbi:MAG: NYN domain-containing protein [Candidatus Omnitrophica bacterium]|nr:NYN domain-containing protein [Candidatus Omnitrophota bacterium]